MSNMSYCRHENTSNDLFDVVENWVDIPMESLSKTEQAARKRIISLARKILEMEGEL